MKKTFLTFIVLFVSLSSFTQICGTCSNPDCSITDNTTATDGNISTFNDCYTLSTPATSGTVDNCYTITTNSTGKLGFRLSEDIGQRTDGNDTGQCSNAELDAIDATRTYTLMLASDGCGGTAISPDATNVNNSATGFNPEWYSLQPNTTYTLCTSVTVAPGGNCQFEKVCMVGYHLTGTANSGCNADIGNYNISNATQVSTFEYDLDDGCSINLDLSNLVVPSGGEVRWAVFSQAPNLPLTASQLNDLTSVPGFLGTDGNQATSVSNSGGQSSSPAGYTTLWAVPFTTDNTSTSTQVDDGDDCYDIQANAIQINFTNTPCNQTPQNDCGSCTLADCPVNQVSTFANRSYASDCNTINPDITNQTYITYHTVTTDVNGAVGLVQGTDINPSPCTGLSRTAVLRPATNTCSASDISPNTTNANSIGSGFNPEWYGLTPSTNYVAIVTTVIPSGCMYGEGCLNAYGIPNPPDPCAMQNGSVQTCNCEFTDSGGNSSNYGASENNTFTICPDPAQTGAKIQLDFTSFAIEDGYDFMYIYDGTTANGQPIVTVSGSDPVELNSTIAATISNTSGCLTVLFTSDFVGQDVGWTADVSCYTPCTTPIADATVNGATNQTIKICPGDQVSFDGTSSVHNASSISNYSWNFGEGTTGSLSTANITYNEPGRYIPTLNVTNDEGCTSTNALPYEILVSTIPNFVGTTDDQVSCEGAQVCLDGVINYPTKVSVPTVPPTGTVSLPDGTGVAYETTVTIGGYASGQTIQSATDLQSICVNMEHSALDDITITLIAPTGEQIILHNRGGGASALGIPALDANAASKQFWNCDFGGPASGPGTGWDYCFLLSASETLKQHGDNNWDPTNNPCYQIPAGDYLPIDNFSQLIGADLNGTWTIRYEDASGNDDGYLFGWDLTFDPSLLPASATIAPIATTQVWTGPSTIDVNNNDNMCATPDNTGINTYTFTVTNDFGCVSDTTIDITVNASEQPIINCGTLTQSSVEFTIVNSLTGVTDYNITYTVNGSNSTTVNNVNFPYTVSSLNNGDVVDITVTPNGTGCYIDGTGQCTAQSCTPPTISTQPSANPDCEGNSLTLSVVAANATGYQWQVSTDGGNNWTNVTASAVYSGETTANLNISDNTGLDTYQYQLIVSETSGNCPVTSTPVTLTVTPYQTTTVSCGTSTQSSVTFDWTSVTSATDYDLSYTINGGAAQTVNNLNAITYQVTGLSQGDVVTITVTPIGTGCFTSANGSCTAQSCTPPTISTQPSANPDCEGNNLTLSVVAANATGYQWQVSTDGGNNWTDISASGIYSGETTANLSISDNSGLDTYQYQVVVSETSGNCPVTSNPVTLTVTPYQTTTVSCGTSTQSSVTFDWTAVTGATGYDLSYTINGGAAQTVNNLNAITYQVTGLSQGDVVAVTVTPIGTGCYTSANGSCTAQNCTPPTISTQPSANPDCEGNSLTLSVTATNATGYQWQVSTDGGNNWTNVTASAVYSGETTANLSISDNTGLDTYQYQVIVSETSGNCPVTSTPVTLTVSEFIVPTISCGIETDTSVTFNWTSPTGATDYDLSYTINNGVSVNIGNQLTTSYTVNGLSVGDIVTITVSTNGTGCYSDNTVDCSPSCVKPSVSFLPDPLNMTTVNTNTIMINNTLNANSYSWDFGDGSTSNEISPSHSYSDLDTGTYVIKLIAYGSGNCIDSLTKIVRVREELIYYIPNTFTPYDRNDYNPVFKPIFYSGFETRNYSMQIFDRWGKLIYYTTNIDEGWDGKDQNTGRVSQDGTYVYKIEFGVKSLDDRKVITGNINLLR